MRIFRIIICLLFLSQFPSLLFSQGNCISNDAQFQQQIDQLQQQIEQLRIQITPAIGNIRFDQESGAIILPDDRNLNQNFRNLVNSLQTINNTFNQLIMLQQKIIDLIQQRANKEYIDREIVAAHLNCNLITNIGNSVPIKITPIAENIAGSTVIIIARSDTNTLLNDGIVIASISATNYPCRNILRGEVLDDHKISYSVAASIHYPTPIGGSGIEVKNNSLTLPVKRGQPFRITIENELNISYNIYWIPFTYNK